MHFQKKKTITVMSIRTTSNKTTSHDTFLVESKKLVNLINIYFRFIKNIIAVN